jgi:hypothetical protein
MAKSEGTTVSDRRIEELTAEADHARRAYELYKAKVYSSRPTSPGRLRELKRTSEIAQMRLIRARNDA